MKKAMSLIFFVVWSIVTYACPVCENQQPEITRGITHGAGPQSNWDWVIISLITAITLFTLVFSLKYIIKPGEKNINHIKHIILSNEDYAGE